MEYYMSEDVLDLHEVSDLKNEVQCEPCVEEEKLGDAGVPPAMGQSPSRTAMQSCRDERPAEDQVWADLGIHTEEHFAFVKIESEEEDYDFEIGAMESLRFDLLPDCNVLLPRLKVNTGGKYPSRALRGDDLGSPCEAASVRHMLPLTNGLAHRVDCNTKCSSELDLETHVRTCSSKPFSCTHCAIGFAWASSLRRHQKEVHAGFKRSSLSDNGISVTRNVGKIASHLEKGKYCCAFCKEKFSRNYYLKLHTRIHSGEKPYVCALCGAKFSIRGSLQRHVRTHSGDRPYACAQCGMAFNQRTHLSTHLNTHSSVKHTCSVCGVAFSQELYLTRHARTHTGERPYSCSVCGKNFVNTSSASRHMRIHTGRKPYSCAHCRKRFTMKEALKSHVYKCSRRS